MHAVAALLVLLAVCTQAVSSSAFFVSFSQIKQCGSFQVNFTSGPNGAPPALPVTLTILPFFAAPVIIPIPLDTWDNTTAQGSAVITFLPFNAGTQFIASLDDANGQGMGLVSDVMQVQMSNNGTCLPSAVTGKHKNDADFYNIKGNLNQCSKFNVTFDPLTIPRPPTIRAFLPRSFSFPINMTSSPPQPGNQEYILDIIHGFQALLLLDDGAGHRETTPLFTAGGDTSSSSTCFPFDITGVSGQNSSQSNQVSTTTTPANTGNMSLSAKIIVGVVCAAVVIVVGAVMFYVIKRKRNRNLDLVPYDNKSFSKSFNFTEDVDMGSSFMARVRSRLSQFWGSSNTSVAGEKRSYKTMGEKPTTADGSYGALTSPRGSFDAPPPPEKSQTVSAMRYTCIERMLNDSYFNDPSPKLFPINPSSVSEARAGMSSPSSAPPYPLPVIDPPPNARLRASVPDAPVSPRTFRRMPNERYRYGSGWKSETSSGLKTGSESSFGNKGRASELRSSFGDGRRRNTSGDAGQPTNLATASIHSSDFVFVTPRIFSERRDAGRVSPFPLTPIGAFGSRRSSRISRTSNR